MPVLESDIEGPVCKWADDRSIEHIKLNLQGNRSYPDRLFFIPGGKPTLIEFKRPGGKLRALQLNTVQRLKRLGYDVNFVDQAAAGIRILQNACTRAALGQSYGTPCGTKAAQAER